jgi:hypothetical protein
MGKTYFDPWQNPTYPQDVGLTDDEIAAGARAASLQRAQSPGPLTCQIDGTWSLDDQFHHDPYSVCMDFRYRHVIGVNDPWTFWQLPDGPLLPPKSPIPPLPLGLLDWQVRAYAGTIPAGTEVPIIPPTKPGAPARVWARRIQANPGLSQQLDTNGVPMFDQLGNPIMVPNDPAMTGKFAGWNGWTFANAIVNDPSVLGVTAAAYATRITLVGSFKIDGLYMGTMDSAQWMLATVMHRFQFWTDQDNNYIPNDPNHANPNGQLSNSVIATVDDAGNFIPVVTEPLAVGFDGTNGLMISGYLDPGGNGVVGYYQSDDPTIANNMAAFADVASDPVTGLPISAGDTASNNDKINYQYQGFSSMAVLLVEGLYDPKQVPAGVVTSPT